MTSIIVLNRFSYVILVLVQVALSREMAVWHQCVFIFKFSHLKTVVYQNPHNSCDASTCRVPIDNHIRMAFFVAKHHE